jgi:SAM-dependent methyltransferase
VNSLSVAAAALEPGLPREKFRDVRTEALAELILERSTRPIRRLLVVGCGSGKEAAVLAQVLGAETTGIDLLQEFDPDAAARVDLRRGDATAMEFRDGSFDFVYSYHALEHIPDHLGALREMRRVLADGGGFCVGTPNRLRLIGYFGSPDTSAREKLRWNLIDWKARLRGKFRNEYGAHAGFSSSELAADLQHTLGAAEDITLPYYLRVYRNHAGLCRMLAASGLSQVIYPCVYFLGRRAPAH